MSKARFDYILYIRADADRVWNGLVDVAFTRLYWLHENVSDWAVGSGWEHVRADGSGVVDIVGRVEESDWPRRLVLTWAQPEDETIPGRTSRVAFDLSPEGWPNGPWTGLRITHSDLEPDSEMFRSISHGWPALLSGLKTLLETGEYPPAWS